MQGNSTPIKSKLITFIHNIRIAIIREPIPFVVLLLAAGGFFAFSKLASEVVEGESLKIDTLILHMLRNSADSSYPWGPQWLEEMMRDFTGLGGVGVLTLVTLSAAIYLYLIKRKDLMVYLLTAVGIGTIFNNLLKYVFGRARPELFPHGSITDTASFPSGHSLVAAIVYLTIGLMLAEAQKRYSIKTYILSLSILIILLVGISRVYLQVHWPSDVLAGWLGGTAWALMFWIIAHYMRKGRRMSQ